MKKKRVKLSQYEIYWFLLAGFANFYQLFIQGFSRIAIPLIAMLKIVRLSIESTSRTDDNEVIGGISVKSGGTIDRLDV